MAKFISTFVLLLMIYSNTNGQNNYPKLWKDIQAFEDKGQTASALQQARKIYNLAIADKNDVQFIKAVIYINQYRNDIEPESEEKNYRFIDSTIKISSTPARNILYSMQAEQLSNYRNRNSYRINNRTATSDEGKDFTTWSQNKFNEVISLLYKQSLENPSILQRTPVAQFDDILEKGKNTRKLRPTLYDFLVFRAINYYTANHNTGKPIESFSLNDTAYLSTVQNFINLKLTTKDTASNEYQAIRLYQQVLQFHVNDGNRDALLDADFNRISFVHGKAAYSDKNNHYLYALERLEKEYEGLPGVAQIMYTRAAALQRNGKASTNIPSRDICKAAIAKYPGTEGAANCLILLNEVVRSSITFTTENINLPDKPFRFLLKYTNAERVYFRIYKATKEELKYMNEDKKFMQFLAANPSAKSWNNAIPDPKDLVEHKVEINAPALQRGLYILVASLRPDFSKSDNIIVAKSLVISQLAYVNNYNGEFYVVDRETGQAIERATIRLYKREYNYRTGEEMFQNAGSYTTDQNGFVKITRFKNDYDSKKIEVSKDDDILYSEEYFYNSGETDEPKKDKFIISWFTDRSIYRPGQTVYFKGIVFKQNVPGMQKKAEAGYKTSIQLMDANGQLVSRLQVTTNEYGSFNGKFVLPQTGLNGQFSIRDSGFFNSTYFQVEEYKRPKFNVEIKKPDAAYKVNDKVTVQGTAKGYASNSIDKAKVTYRVFRTANYPVWAMRSYRSWYPINTSSQEIAQGETITDEKGSFSISFNAMPDPEADKELDPEFNFEIRADVTDNAGESRSATSNVKAGFHAIKLDVASEETIPADSVKNIRITTTNAAGEFIASPVRVSIEKLQSPNKVYNTRLWDKPDQFILKKEEFEKLFPNDPYKNEDDKSTWTSISKTELTDTSRKDGSLLGSGNKWSAGWYKISASVNDKNGDTVKAISFVRIVENGKANADQAFYLYTPSKTLQPGDKTMVQLSTGFKDATAFVFIQKPDKNTSFRKIAISSNPVREAINIDETDRGGITYEYFMVRNNRFYTGTSNITVPWTNKQLDISFETFRDKTLPGSHEQWKIHIKGKEADKIAAETLISMYDASLDQFRFHQWNSLQPYFGITGPVKNWVAPLFNRQEGSAFDFRVLKEIKVPEKSYDYLIFNSGFYISSSFLSGSVSGLQIRGDNNGMDTRIVLRGATSFKNEEADSTVFADIESKHTKFPKPQFPISQNNGDTIQVRKNLQETAFFFPTLLTDSNGNVSFAFDMPEALTTWKMMVLAHTKELASGYAEKNVISQKPLMVQPNLTRFLRQSDKIEIPVKISNVTDKEITGTAQLEVLDAVTNQPIDGWFKNVFPTQYFTAEANQSASVKFPVEVPANYSSAVTFRIKAVSVDKQYSDGEESALPVLSNRILVTESFPISMRNTNQKEYRFEKLINSNSPSLQHQSLTVEYTSNPVWLVIQSLPYLTEFPYECAEQTFNRYYANTLAAGIVAKLPKLAAILQQWKEKDTAALLSNLQKNQELKSALLEETPWVMEANNEAKQKQNIIQLFDLVRLAKEQTATLEKLKSMQLSSGGFPWFKGGNDNLFITQYILSGIGHLKKLNMLNDADSRALQPIIEKGLYYADRNAIKEYNALKTAKAKKDFMPGGSIIQYLYLRSFFAEFNSQNAIKERNYFIGQTAKYWLRQDKYLQAMSALVLARNNNKPVANNIMRSLQENAVNSEEMGMYFKDLTAGFYWYQAPVETQSLIIEAFSEITGNTRLVNELKTWLLKQKQTQNWRTTKATADACYAILLTGSNWSSQDASVNIQLGNTTIKPSASEAGTGYIKERIEGGKIQPDMGNIKVTVTGTKDSASPSWGAVYWQYFEDINKITAANTPLKLNRQIYRSVNTNAGVQLQPLKEGEELSVGDKITVRITVKCDRAMEYLHMKDLRAAAFEPVDVISAYKWQNGLGYYQSTKDASMNFFFDRMVPGSYVFEYSLFVSQSGSFSNGITTIQCMYAPEFSSHSEGFMVDVK